MLKYDRPYRNWCSRQFKDRLPSLCRVAGSIVVILLIYIRLSPTRHKKKGVPTPLHATKSPTELADNKYARAPRVSIDIDAVDLNILRQVFLQFPSAIRVQCGISFSEKLNTTATGTLTAASTDGAITHHRAPERRDWCALSWPRAQRARRIALKSSIPLTCARSRMLWPRHEVGGAGTREPRERAASGAEA